jgi:hypothetical protein
VPAVGSFHGSAFSVEFFIGVCWYCFAAWLLRLGGLVGGHYLWYTNCALLGAQVKILSHVGTFHACLGHSKELELLKPHSFTTFKVESGTYFSVMGK